MINEDLEFEIIKPVIEFALQEDIGDGDITTDYLIPYDMQAIATMTAKADGVIAGLDVACTVFSMLNQKVICKKFVSDGNSVKKGDLILEIDGSYRALLSGERVALNFLQRMSGIATMTSLYVDKLKDTGVKILDTRKTAPGLRILDKYAVKMGGGMNHRIGLYDMILIKDNHIKVAGSILKAVEQIRSKLSSDIDIEVETTNIEEVKEALVAGADIIMLDNMDLATMSECVQLINKRVKVEASGNMTLDRIHDVALTGVDFISTGALTHSITALDISMNIESLKY